jgi:hypothetical protein
VTVAAPRGNDGDSQRAYEALRSFALGGGCSGGRGLVVLLREGLAAWLAQRCGGGAAVDAVSRPRSHDGGSCVSAPVDRDVVRVLASMVLGRQEHEATA